MKTMFLNLFTLKKKFSFWTKKVFIFDKKKGFMAASVFLIRGKAATAVRVMKNYCNKVF
jgi:hypothetical protein